MGWIEDNVSWKNEQEYDAQFGDAPKGNLNTFTGGPYGLGDPEDNSLIPVETRFGLPAKRREIIFRQFCPDVAEAFTTCKQRHPYTKWFKCSDVTEARKNCIDKYWNTPGLAESAKAEYLLERTLYRSTGMKKHEREKNERDPVTFLFGMAKRRSYKEYQSLDNRSFWNVFTSPFSEDASNNAPKVETSTESSCNQKDETIKN